MFVAPRFTSLTRHWHRHRFHDDCPIGTCLIISALPLNILRLEDGDDSEWKLDLFAVKRYLVSIPVLQEIKTLGFPMGVVVRNWFGQLQTNARWRCFGKRVQDDG